MNINDFEADEFNKESWLDEVFARQTGVMLKYQEIEGMPNWPFNINTRESQKWIKDFLWRTTEELMESLEAYKNLDMDHTIEELADGLHFLTELCILAGKDSKWAFDSLTGNNTYNIAGSTIGCYTEAVYWLGMVGNTLKNKPWKQTEMLTDENKFDSCLRNAFYALIEVFKEHGKVEEDIYNYYTRKNKVNQFRQRSNY